MSVRPNAVMIFAAGFGTRMMPLTKDRPKPMVELLGRPMIDYTLDLVRQVQPQRVVVNAHYKADVLKSHLNGRDVTIVEESPEILDTGGGLRNARPFLGAGPVWTINPDAVWNGPNPLEWILTHWEPDQMDALLLCIDPARALGRHGAGDFVVNADGRISRHSDVVYGGVQVIKTDQLDLIKDSAFSLNIMWDKMIERGSCFGAIYPGHWCDVGHPGGLSLAEDLLKAAPDV